MDVQSPLPTEPIGFNLIYWLLIDVPRAIWIGLVEGRDGGVQEAASDLYTGFFVVSSIVSLALIAGGAYAFVKLWRLRAEEEYVLKHPETPPAAAAAPREEEGKIGSLKWQVVERHIASANPSDWRLAVLEADIMLDDMVRGFGYEGINLGERLKAANRASFATLDEAWEAHKIRNAIAHEGSGFELSEREARRVINLYRAVFEEFNYI